MAIWLGNRTASHSRPKACPETERSACGNLLFFGGRLLFSARWRRPTCKNCPNVTWQHKGRLCPGNPNGVPSFRPKNGSVPSIVVFRHFISWFCVKGSVLTFDTSHVFYRLRPAASRFDTLVQLPICSRCAIHLSVVVVSSRNRRANATLCRSPPSDASPTPAPSTQARPSVSRKSTRSRSS